MARIDPRVPQESGMTPSRDHHKRLADLKPGEQGTIETIHAHPETAGKLMQIGLCPGETVRVLRHAPLGGPVELDVMGYRLAIRREDAAEIELQ